MTQIEEFVRKAIAKRIALLIQVEHIGRQEKLELWGLDALNIVEICADIEEQYKITINEEEIVERKLNTIEDFCDYISSSTEFVD